MKERLGREADGWNERKAERELRHRLADVERKGYRRPVPLTFATYSNEWLDECERRRNWRPRTATVNREQSNGSSPTSARSGSPTFGLAT